MLKNRLPRYATDLRVLGVSALDAGHQWDGFAAPAFPQNNDGGTGSGGGGGAGGTGGSGSGSTDDSGEGDGSGDGDKLLADMSDAEKVEFWRKQARANERKLKGAPKPEELTKLQEAAAELEKIRDSQRSDSEKAVARAEKAEAELATITPRVMRLEVALAKGLTEKQAARLVGDTREALEADADELLTEIGASTGAKETKDKEKRTAARKATGADAGVRGSRDDTKGTVATGADLFASRHKKAAAAASTA